MTPLHLITAGILVITLTTAAILDFRYREVPRSVWLGAFLVAMPLGVIQWFGTYRADQGLAILNLLIVLMIVVSAWFAAEMEWQFNMGDFIGLAVVFVSLCYSVYPLVIMFFAGIWGIIIAGSMMIRHRSFAVNDIPYLVPLALGLYTTLIMWR